MQPHIIPTETFDENNKRNIAMYWLAWVYSTRMIFRTRIAATTVFYANDIKLCKKINNILARDNTSITYSYRESCFLSLSNLIF